MPITPYVGMVDAALRFKSGTPPVWLCIGRYTPWDDENAPPNENDFTHHPEYLDVTVPEEPIALKRVDFMGLCVPDANGDIRYLQQRYSYVSDTSAVSLLARWCYIRASLNYYEKNSAGNVVIGSATYRQATLLSGVVSLPAFKNESVLAPSQVQSYGRIVCVTNFSPRERDPKMRDVLEFVREFRG